MEKEEDVDQFMFERCVDRYLRRFQQSGWGVKDDQPVMLLLNAIMRMSVYPHVYGNDLKAHLMIIISSVIRLQELDIENNLDSLEEDYRTETLKCLTDLQLSVKSLEVCVQSPPFRRIHNRSLFLINALLVKLITMTGFHKSPDAEVSECLLRTMESMKSVTDLTDQEETTIVEQCEQAIAQPGATVDFPSFPEFWTLIRKLVINSSRCVQGLSESCFQLQVKKDDKEQNKHSFSPQRFRKCRLSHLQEIMGRALDDSDNEQEVAALLEKCERIKKKLRHSSSSSQERVKSHTVRETETLPRSSSPKKSSSVSAEGVGTTKKARTTVDSDSDAGLDESITDKSITNNKFPTLAPVKPRLSLLKFGDSRKPPSHSRGMQGKWLPDEEEVFIVKTLEIGEGKWAEIKSAMNSGRSSVQLKDKWRQITLSRVKKVAREHGLNNYKCSKR